MRSMFRLVIPLAFAVMCLAAVAGCTQGASTDSPTSDNPASKEVTNVDQLQVSAIRHSVSEIGEKTGNGAYGEYTEVVLESSGYEALAAVLAERNESAAEHTKQRVTDHANDSGASGVVEGHSLDVLLGGTDNTVDATPFINYLNACAVTRADSNLVCLLEAEIAEDEGWGKKVRFTSTVLDASTGEALKLGDLCTDTSQLPGIIDEALRQKYIEEDMIGEDEDPAAVVRAKLDADQLTWTADYLGMRFYFNSADFEHADSYQGMYVSVPYAEHPGLFTEVCTATPDDFIAQLEYDVAYELPGDAQGRSVLITRSHQEGATLGLLGTSPTPMTAGAGWTFHVQVGTQADGSFTATGEETNSPWYYDMDRQDYMPCLVCVGGRYFIYGFGDRNSDDLKTCVYDLNGEMPAIVKEIDTGFAPQVTYTKWAFPRDPAAVTMADRDCIAAYDRVMFERNCAINAETGLPDPETAEFAAHTINEAYAMRVDVNGIAINDDGTEGEATVIPEGTVCVLESGVARDHYNMRLEDGSLVRLPYDAKTYKIDGHYGKDIISIVPAAAADTARIETGAKQQTGWQHGREVLLVPETGNIVGDGAIIDYGDTPWWVAEEFVGTWKPSDDDLAELATWYSDGNPPTDVELVIREDGTFSFKYDGVDYDGKLDDTRGYHVYAGGVMSSEATGYAQDVTFDYTSESESSEKWSRIEFRADGAPYPMSEQVMPIMCYLTRS